MPATLTVDDAGITFRITILDETGAALDVSGATTKEIRFEKPNKTTLTKAATFTTDGTDGKIQYFSVAADLDQPGDWEWIGRVILPGDKEYATDVLEFEVRALIGG